MAESILIKLKNKRRWKVKMKRIFLVFMMLILSVTLVGCEKNLNMQMTK